MLLNIQTEYFLNYPGHKTVIIICGPTAVGKTAVSVRLAGHFQTEIISADSRQCYKELAIGVARPSSQDLQLVKHHFIASHSVQEEIHAAFFEKYALEKTKDLFRQYDRIVMTGGTGLYLKAFSEGLDSIPAIEPSIREHVIRQYEEKGIEWLQRELTQKDPLFHKTGEMQNPQRMIRALEVMEATGHSILSFRTGEKAVREFNMIKIGIGLPKEELHRNIHARTEQMMEAGLLDEVKKLIPFKKMNALQTVGYKELFHYLDGFMSLEEAVARIKTNTRQYAKRQLTWFRKDKSIHWFEPQDIEGILQYIEKQL